LDALEGKLETGYPFYILYQAIAIMKNGMKLRCDLKEKVIEYILRQIKLRSVPVHNNE
jgi:hypothetical protein